MEEERAQKRRKPHPLPTGINKSSSGKYYGQVSDFVHKARNPGSKQKNRYTTSFATVEEAVKAYDELKATMTSEYNAIILDRVAKNPYTRDLEQAPDDAADATPRRVYWRCNRQTSFEPKRMVATKASNKQGFQWHLACVHCPPDDASKSKTGKGTTNEQPACITHGERCSHGRYPRYCIECTHGVAGKPIPHYFCSQGCGIILNRKRQRTAGGNGICSSCEERAKREAIEAGDPGSASQTSERWEDKLFKETLPIGIVKTRNGKYYGQVKDRVHSAKNPGTKEHKNRHTTVFATVEEAVEARDEIKANMTSEYDAIILDRVAKNPLVRDLEEGPDDASDATPRRVYWRCNYMTSFEPKRMVAIKCGKQGFVWQLACVHCPPDDASVSMTAKGTTNEEPACTVHGARCSHGRQPGHCMECTHGIAGKPIPGCFCSQGCGIVLYRKRQRTAGGNGLCPSCEERLKREAIEAGDPDSLPQKSKRWEDTFFEKMLPLVTNEKDEVIPYDQRDDIKYMLGSNKQARRGECDTEHQRRPDCMWSVRCYNWFAVAFVVVEVDEDSHSNRDPKCESARMQDIQFCLLQKSQQQGRKSDLAVTRRGEIVPPQVYFLRVNPNACDAPGGAIPLQTRAEVIADRVSELLRTPPEVFVQMWKADQQMLPHVELYYYHSKNAKHLLDHYDEKVEELALDVVPNQCPRSVEEARKARESKHR